MPLNSSVRPRAIGRSASLFQRVRRAWQCLFISLLVDPLLALEYKGTMAAPISSAVATSLALLILPFLATDQVRRTLAALRRLDKSHMARKNTPLPFILAIVLTFLAVAKVGFALSIHTSGIFAALAPLLLLVVAVVMMRRTRAERDQARLRFAKDPQLYIARWEAQILVFSIGPMIAARCVSLLGPLTSNLEWWNTALFMVTGSLLLAMLAPHKEAYVGICKRCKQPVPVVLSTLGSCPRCDPALRSAAGSKASAP